MKKVIWFLIIASVVMTIVEATPMEDWAYDEWVGFSQTQQVAIVWAFMHFEENQKAFARYLGRTDAYNFINDMSTVDLSVGQIVDLISDYYRRWPERRREPIATVYMAIGIWSQELRREGRR